MKNYTNCLKKGVRVTVNVINKIKDMAIQLTAGIFFVIIFNAILDDMTKKLEEGKDHESN